MKLRCIDGITRDFQVVKRNKEKFKSVEQAYDEAYCKNCGEKFPHVRFESRTEEKLKFKHHICEIKETE